MITMNIVGTGNIAWHLAKQFAKHPDVTLLQVAGRTLENCIPFKKLSLPTGTIEDLTPVDITIIAVSDQAIDTVAQQLPYTNTLVVHTAGSIPMNAITPRHRKGVFYPLQSFSKEDTVDFTIIPICIEAQEEHDKILLNTLASMLSNKVHFLDSTQRKKVHLAAVFANNFTNHCYTIAAQICKDDHIPFDILHPLIQKTMQKAIAHGPDTVQTGPAKRQDIDVINNQQETLTHEDHKSVYKTLTASILSYYGKEL